MLQKYVIIHAGTGVTVVVSGYTPEQAQAAAWLLLNRYTDRRGLTGRGHANAGNTAVRSAAGAPVVSKLSTAGPSPTTLPPVLILPPGHVLPPGFAVPAGAIVRSM